MNRCKKNNGRTIATLVAGSNLELCTTPGFPNAECNNPRIKHMISYTQVKLEVVQCICVHVLKLLSNSSSHHAIQHDISVDTCMFSELATFENHYFRIQGHTPKQPRTVADMYANMIIHAACGFRLTPTSLQRKVHHPPYRVPVSPPR